MVWSKRQVENGCALNGEVLLFCGGERLEFEQAEKSDASSGIYKIIFAN